MRFGRRLPAGRTSSVAAGDAPRVGAVTDVDEDALCLDGLEPGASPHGLVEEHGVLGQGTVGKLGLLLPYAAPVYEGPPVYVAHEETAVQVGPAAPEAPGSQVEHETAAQRGDVGLASPDGRRLAGQPSGPVPVVVIPVGHDAATGQPARFVPHRPDAPQRHPGGD